MKTLPNLRHLNALLAIQRHGSITAAAEAAHLSQPAITQSLNNIESSLGVKLFERSAQGVDTTTVGQIFLRRLERALAYLEAFTSEVGGTRPWQQLFTSVQLRAVVAVVEHGNISLAASTLGLSQPSVHRAAREAESVCGEPLFLRKAGGVEATPTARRLARLASQAFAELQQGIEEVREYQGRMDGSLRIGSLPLARTDLVPTAVTQLLAEYPDARVSIVDGPYEELLDMLLHGRIDMIVGALRQPAPVRDIQQIKLFDDPLAVVVRVGHPLLTDSCADNLTLEHIASLPWIAPRNNTPARRRFRKLFANNKLEPPAQLIECSSSAATRSLLLQSDRVALLSIRQVLPEIRLGLLATLPMSLDVSRSIGFTLRENWEPTRVQGRYLEILESLSAST